MPGRPSRASHFQMFHCSLSDPGERRSRRMPGRNERKSLHLPYRSLHELDNEAGIEGIVDIKAGLDLIRRKRIQRDCSVYIGNNRGHIQSSDTCGEGHSFQCRLEGCQWSTCDIPLDTQRQDASASYKACRETLRNRVIESMHVRSSI